MRYKNINKDLIIFPDKIKDWASGIQEITNSISGCKKSLEKTIEILDNKEFDHLIFKEAELYTLWKNFINASHDCLNIIKSQNLPPIDTFGLFHNFSHVYSLGGILFLPAPDTFLFNNQHYTNKTQILKVKFKTFLSSHNFY